MSETSYISTTHSGHVATVVFNRPPHNFANPQVMRELLQTLEALDADDNCRCVVLTSEGKNFCAGVDFSGAVGEDSSSDTANEDTGDIAAGLYATAMRLFTTRKPIVAAVQGAAVGAGAGLAAMAGVLAAPVIQITPLMGSNLIIVVFAVVVIGGMGSILGSILTGVMLGLMEGLTKVFYPEASSIVVFVIMVIVLMVRPAGLFGKEK